MRQEILDNEARMKDVEAEDNSFESCIKRRKGEDDPVKSMYVPGREHEDEIDPSTKGQPYHKYVLPRKSMKRIIIK